MKITFIDRNTSLVEKVKKAVKHFPVKIEVKEGDIFNEEGVIVSASNPSFSMGGGLDAQIAKRFPEESALVQKKKKMQQIGDVMFVVTVDENIKASRDIVDEALAFAFNKKNHLKPDQTLLVTGLGTAIGGLDEDDFVWLFLKNLSIAYGYGWGIKFTQKNGTDFRTGTVKYVPGKKLVQEGAKEYDKGADCGVGLHLGKSFIGAGNYNIPEKIFFCLYEKDDLCGEGEDKVRVEKLLVVCGLPQWLGYGLNGKKVVGKLGKKFNPEKYNPYQATKLPELDAIKKTGLRAQVWAQVWDQVRAQVGAQVGAQVRAQVRDQVGAQVWAQVRDQVWAQVRAQVGATCYWAVNIHFELGVSHWFGNLLSLGVMPIFVSGKVKFFGKKGKYLGEYDEKDLLS